MHPYVQGHWKSSERQQGLPLCKHRLYLFAKSSIAEQPGVFEMLASLF